MNAVLRSLVVFIMLITLTEKLLPQGKLREAGKAGLGLIMLSMLLNLLNTLKDYSL